MNQGMDGEPQEKDAGIEFARSRACFLLGGLFAVLVVYSFFKHALLETWNYTGFDWGIYYGAAQDLRSGKSPYPPEVLEQSSTGARATAWNKYMYPPLFARLLVPLTWLSDLWAKRVFQIVCCLFYLYLLLPRGGIGETGSSDPADWVGRWCAIAFVFGWGPSIETIRLGQSNLLPLCLIAASFRILSSRRFANEEPIGPRREMLAGVFLGIASAVKLTPLAILPILVVTWRLRIAFAMAVGFVCAMVLPGPWTCWQYVTLVVPTFSEFPPNQQAYTLSSLLARWDGISSVAFPAAVFFFSFLLVFFFSKRRHLLTCDSIAAGCWLPAIFGGVWFHHYALAALPIAVGVRLLAGNWWKEVETVRVGLGESEASHPREEPFTGSLRIVFLNPPFLRLAAFVIVLLPGMTYWLPVSSVVGAIASFECSSFLSLFVVGNVAAFLIFLYELSREKSPSE